MNSALGDKELSLFKKEIEEYFKIKPETKKDYQRLNAHIDHELVKQAESLPKNEKGNPIIPKEKTPSSETLMRIWGYVKSEAEPRKDTYSILARSMGYISLEDALEKIKEKESEKKDLLTEIAEMADSFKKQISSFEIKKPDDENDWRSSYILNIKPEELEVGAIIKLELSSDKYSVLKHLDDFFHFKVIEMKGMNKEVGTEFWTPGFEIVKDSAGNEYIKLTDHGYGWFDNQNKLEEEKRKKEKSAMGKSTGSNNTDCFKFDDEYYYL
ncbi:hypothetical protein E2605_04265 [Dysgonomonas capnocytophagoides]|uniref:Uncharacterized protein n=1 Tax=Dysgonomonas capnocytophagoides TaxID=45254 RepID=A0A4Y8L6B7_9BACT|nr:hypothetical protein [Dysgonomonas capnocytophagoides]TFD97837.1 hypothetical protein E2605_04265 [Dysgonomonas capnocytophagoides]